MHPQRIAVCIFALLGALSAFMPWIDLPILPSKSGTDLCGWVCFTLYLVTIVAALLPKIKMSFSDFQLFAVITPASLASAAVIWQMLHLREEYGALVDNPISKALDFEIEYELGFYLSLLSGMLIAVIAVLFRLLDRKTVPS